MDTFLHLIIERIDMFICVIILKGHLDACMHGHSGVLYITFTRLLKRLRTPKFHHISTLLCFCSTLFFQLFLYKNTSKIVISFELFTSEFFSKLDKMRGGKYHF